LNQGGELVLYRATFSATTQVGPYAGQTYLHGWEERNIVPTPTGYDIIASAYPYMNAEQNGLPAVKPWMWIQRKTVSTINGKTYTTTSTKKILKDDIEARTGLTEEQLGYQTRIVYHCKAVDPAKYITSIFGLVEKQGNTYYNKSLINGQDWHTQITKGLIQPFGKVLSPMKFSWVVYNGCSTGTAPQGAVGWGMFHGNFGECYRYMSDATSSYSDYITIVNGASFIANQAGTVTVNSTQPCILEIVPAWTPAPEKNTAESGYFNINTGQPVFSLY
jgi:hypothetical protein